MAKLFPMVSWARGCSLYEVNIRQYSAEGSFKAFRRHLPRLVEMGVEVLWLMPVTPISLEKRQGTLGSYYACSSYTAVNPEFGSAEDLKELIAESHAKGLKVVIDWVANHTGWDHHWTVEHPGWFYKDKHGAFYDKNGWIDVVDLDYSNNDMRKEMIRSMQYWIDVFDIDGFRCDMAHLVPLDFWMEARGALDQVKPLLWLAETDNNDYHEVFDLSYAWSWMHKSEQFIQGKAGLAELKQELVRFEQLPADSYKLLFTSNHDENSWNGTEYEKYGDAARAMAVLCCTYRAQPLVYSGQEIPNKKRLRFFDKDEIQWPQQPALQSFYQLLLQMRRESNALRYGSVQFLHTGADEHALAYIRKFEERVTLVLINFSATEKLRLSLHSQDFHGVYYSLFSGLPYHFQPAMEFELEPWGWLVYHR